MFVFSLAQELGMTVENMLNSMSSQELCYWHAYSELVKEQADWEIKKMGGK